jgi:suppressor for copper-sensitivity B
MSKKLLFLTLALLGFLPAPARAQQTWTIAEQSRARLVSAVKDTGGQKGFEAGIEIELTDGWHTYWRMPGDAGLPPRFDWSGSRNIEAPDVLYPIPERMDEAGLQIFGYKDRVFFPLDIRVKDPSQPAEIKLGLDIMVCKDICIPQRLDLSLIVASTSRSSPNPGEKTLIAMERKKLPAEGKNGTLEIKTVVAAKDALAVGVSSRSGFERADAVAYTDSLYLTAPPQISPDPHDPALAIITLPKPPHIEDLNKALSGQTLHILVGDGRSAVESEITF